MFPLQTPAALINVDEFLIRGPHWGPLAYVGVQMGRGVCSDDVSTE